jgi:hypothetical protein
MGESNLAKRLAAIAAAGALAIGSAGFAGCGDDEDAGQTVEDAVEDAREGADDAADDVRDAAEDAADEVGDAAEDAREGAEDAADDVEDEIGN